MSRLFWQRTSEPVGEEEPSVPQRELWAENDQQE